MKPLVSFADFDKMDIRIGNIVLCEKKEGSEKLLRLTVDFGEEGRKNILSGIAAWYKPEDLIDKQFLFIINLEPRKIMGEFSEGMLLAADFEKPMPLKPIKKVPVGIQIR